MALQLPPFTWYCSTEPSGQGVSMFVKDFGRATPGAVNTGVPGAVMLPPDTVPLLQVLFTMVTFGGAVVRVGQEEQPAILLTV
jgi:hypothetical protein